MLWESWGGEKWLLGSATKNNFHSKAGLASQEVVIFMAASECASTAHCHSHSSNPSKEESDRKLLSVPTAPYSQS